MPKRSDRPRPNRIEELRLARGLSMAALADLMGTSAGQVNKLEKGDVQLTETWLMSLAKALQCHWTEILKPAEAADPKVAAMVQLFSQLSEDQKDAVIRLATTIAEPRDANGGHGERKKAG